MLSINEIFQNYQDNVSYSEFDGAYIVALPFFFPNSSSSVAIKISFDELGRPLLSDCHTTLDYLDEMEIDIDRHKQQLQKIMRRYDLTLEDRQFLLAVPTDQPYYLTKYLGFFVQALSLIANVDLP